MPQDRSKVFFGAPSGLFFGYNSPNAPVSQGKIWSWWVQGMQRGFKTAYDCVKAFSETDFTEDLKGIEVPVLVLHGHDDQMVPLAASGQQSAELVRDGRSKVFEGVLHALPTMCVDQVNWELLEFSQS